MNISKNKAKIQNTKSESLLFKQALADKLLIDILRNFNF